MSIDVYEINQASKKLRKMRSKRLRSQPLLQSYYPDIPYTGKWVKATKVVADVLAQVVKDWKAKQTGDVMVSEHEIKLAAITALTKYTTSVGGEQCMFLMNAVRTTPITIFRVGLDSYKGERAAHRKKWMQIDVDADNGEFTYIVGYGGDYKAIEEGYGISNPLIGLYLYPFNIRNYWIFQPDYDSDIYGIVNCSKNTLYDEGWWA